MPLVRVIRDALAIGTLLLCFTPLSADAGQLTEVALTSASKGTRLLLRFDAPQKTARSFALADPPRLVVDLPGAVIAGVPAVLPQGPVQRVRVSQFSAEKVRVVLDLKAPAVLSAPATLTSGHGFSVTLKPVSPPVFGQAVGTGVATLALADTSLASALAPVLATSAPIRPMTASAPTAPSRPSGTGARPGSRLPLVMIDPGHGGADPGAPSVLAGRWEKDAVLGVSRAIVAELNASGVVRAALTRDSDIFIPLGRRVELARERGAALFISIHADSHADPAISGATVYTLSESASDKEAATLATKENKADIIAGINLGAESLDVTDILIDLAQRETMNLSSDFATLVAQETSKDVVFRSRYHRFAGFRVLKAPDVPSVLFETGYMSNAADSQRLFSRQGAGAIARGVRRAVVMYFQQRPLVAASVVRTQNAND